MNQAYNHFFFHFTAAPLLIINTNDLDFVNNNEDRDEVIEQIVSAKTGTTYYRPMNSKDKILVEERKNAKANSDNK